MIVRRFEPIRPWADWQTAFRLRDRDSQDLIDLSPYLIEFMAYRDRECCSAALTATTANGKLALFDPQTALVTFRQADLGCLPDGQLYVHCRISLGGEMTPVFTGTVAVSSKD
jgi:hypothetical protein